MLLADKTVGRYVPVRFVTFALVGGLGVFVHMAALSISLKVLEADFLTGQSVATISAMVFNFALNNILTYRDQRLRGWKWWTGLFSFMVACSIGAVANVGVANYLFIGQTQGARGLGRRRCGSGLELRDNSDLHVGPRQKAGLTRRTNHRGA